MTSKSRTLKGTETQAQTRFLLALWDLGGAAVKRGEVMQRVVRTGEKTSDYQSLLDQLGTNKQIVIENQKISLTSSGASLLEQGLKDPGFQFESQIGAKTANALLKWLRQTSHQSPDSAHDNKSDNSSIGSYSEFKEVALKVYDHLNKEHSFDHLVPIYRLRREVGDRLSRSQFNEWSLEMQADDLWQLIGGEMPDITPDKADDSIKTALGGWRYYIKRL